MENFGIEEAVKMINKDQYEYISSKDIPEILATAKDILEAAGEVDTSRINFNYLPIVVKDRKKQYFAIEEADWGYITDYSIEQNALIVSGVGMDFATFKRTAPFKIALDKLANILPDGLTLANKSKYGTRAQTSLAVIRALKDAIKVLKQKRDPDDPTRRAYNIEELAKIVLESHDKDADKEWLQQNIADIKFTIPTCSGDPEEILGLEQADLADKWAEREQELLDKFNPALIEGEDFVYRDAAVEPESREEWYVHRNFKCDIQFKTPINTFELPLDIKELIDESKRLSQRVGKGRAVDFEYNDNKTISSYYLGCAICRIFGSYGSYNISFYKANKKVPVPAANPAKTEKPISPEEVDNPFEQDFDDINAYGEKVESLREAKEEICCICGEPISGYGNNPEPYKHEGRCCDACNLHYVIPARLAALGNNED